MILILIYAHFSYADTVYLKNQDIVKGIVVEDYKDRIVISTERGEREIMKRETEMVVYDEPDYNLIKLGQQHEQRGELQKALYYFKRAYELNPESVKARDGISLVTGAMFRNQQQKKKNLVQRRQALEDIRSLEPEAIPLREEAETDRLYSEVGIKVEPYNANFRVARVARDSPADLAGLGTGDVIVGVWGKLTGYLSKNELVNLMLAPSAMELKLMIEKEVTVEKRRDGFFSTGMSMIGAELEMMIDGLTVKMKEDSGPADKAGLEEGDLLVSIDGKPTRYMPIKHAIKYIEEKTGPVEFGVRRNLSIWRK
jgi:predicted metalloprotease with PDZ domain